MEATQESSTRPAMLMSYKVKPGTRDSGRKYEYKMAALLSLKSLLTEHDMWIASNAPDVGAFDDIVIKLGNVTYLLQLKHKENSKNVTKAELDAHKGDFALEKYLKDIERLKLFLNSKDNQSTFTHYLDNFSDMCFAIFTNRGINDCYFLEQSKESVLDIFNTKPGSVVYRVNVTKLTHSSYAEEIENYNNVYILSNQVSVTTIDDKIREELEKVARHFKLSLLNNIAEIAEKFTKYITDWAEGNFRVDYLLTKTEILQKISELFLYKHQINFVENVFKSYDCTKKLTWNCILKDTNITLVEDGDNILTFLQEYISSEVQKYCGSHSNSLWSTKLSDKDRNRLYKEHPDLQLCIRKTVKTSNIVNYFDIYKCLWTVAEIPLLVEILSAEHYNEILKILQLSGYYHKVVLVSKTGHSLPFQEDFKQVNFFASLNDVKERERNVILASNVSLQGRYPVLLQDLANSSILKFIKCKDIIEILCGSFNIGNNPTPVVDYFIERKISKILIEFAVLDKVKDEQFIIEGEYEEEYRMDSQGKRNVLKLEDFEIHTIAQRKLIGNERYADIAEDKEQEKPTPVTHQPLHHLLVYNRKYFEWKASYGSVKNIKRYLVELENTEGNDILKTLASKKTVLSGIPGIGKSILTDYLAQNAPTNKWIIKIELNAHTKYFEELKEKTSTTKILDHLTYFNDALNHQLKHNVELTNAIFNRFKSSNDIIVLLDGFDEVSVLYEKIVSSIARSFYNAGCHILITTRDHMQVHLENEFDCFSVTLKKFTKEDQTEFLLKYFSSKINNPGSSNLILEFVENLLKATKCNLNDHDLEVTGIPLLSKLLADVFIDDCSNFISGGSVSNFNFDILYLYRTFIDKNIERACKKSGDSSPRETFKVYKKNHLVHALNFLFPKFSNIVEKLTKLPSYSFTNKFDYPLLKLLQRVGIITIDKYSNINFIHRTFSEYMAAKWLAKNIRGRDNKVKKIAQVLVKTRFSSYNTFLFNMFDRILSQNCPLHTQIINGRINEVAETIKSDFSLIVKTDKGERSLLHLILLYNNAEAFKNFSFPFEDDALNCNKENNESKLLAVELFISKLLLNELQHPSIAINIISSIPTEILSGIKPDLLDYTVLDYAVQAFTLNVANELIVKTNILYINATVSLYLKTSYLKLCAQYNYTHLFYALLTYFAYKDLVFNHVQRNTRIETYCKPILRYTGKFRHQTIFELLKSNGKYIFVWFNNCNSNLHYVARFGTKTQILHLLKEGNKVNKSDNEYSNTALHYAVLHSNEKKVDILLKNNAKLNKKNYFHNTPLHLAIKPNNSNIVGALIDHGADIDEQNVDSYTPLHLALEIQHYNIANLLIKKGASVNIENHLGDNVLHLIVNCKYSRAVTDITKKILPNILNINKQNKFGKTALYNAAGQNHLNVVKLLISKGASTNITDEAGDTALHIASICGYSDIVNEILKDTANIHAQNEDGKTALHFAARGNDLNVVKLLISKGASTNITDQNGNNALHIASCFGYNDIVNEILKDTGNIHVQNKYGDTALHFAARRNRLNVVKLLISKGASTNITDEAGDTALHIASICGYSDIVNEILKDTANIHAQNEDGKTALHFAARGNDLNMVKLLISKGASTNITDEAGDTALHIASICGYSDIVNEILKDTANIHAQDEDGKTALHFAARGNDLNMVKLLISKGASTNITDEAGDTALHIASICGYSDIVNEILKDTANIHAQNEDGKTALHFAARGNDLNMVKLLISKGASTNITDQNGNNALHIASCFGYNDIVNEILKDTGNIHVQNKYGDTALHFAARRNRLNVVKLLISKGASTNITDQNGNNALHIASCFGYNDIVNEILKDTGNIHVQNKYGDTALHFAARGNDLNMVKLLISKGASTNITDQNGNNALHIASCFGYNDIVNEILKDTGNIHVQNKYGDTALHFAARRNRLNVVKLLISKGASTNITDEAGDTALHIASICGYSDIVNEILKDTANIHAQNEDGKTALHFAARGNDLNMVKLLISKGASTNITDQNGNNALHIASCFGYNDIVNEILKDTGNIHVQNKYGDTALHLAARRNRLNVVKLLISKGASTNITNKNGNNALHIASNLGYNDIANEILKDTDNIHAQNEDGKTALHYAAWGNDLNMVKLLISKGISTNITNKNGNNALHIASYLGYNDIVNEILKDTDNIHAQNEDGKTALHNAAQRNHLNVVKLLISKGASTNITNKNGNNALHIASNLGYNDIANEILKDTDNIHAQNEDGKTALHYAAWGNDLNMVKLLISKGISTNITNKNGNNALHIASYLGYDDIVNEILKDTDNIHAQNEDGKTALHNAAQRNHLNVVKLLISKGASVDITDTEGNNVLHVASCFGHKNIVNEILKLTANIDVQNKFGHTAHEIAAQKNHLDVVKLLISKGASINITNNEEDGALHTSF